MKGSCFALIKKKICKSLACFILVGSLPCSVMSGNQTKAIFTENMFSRYEWLERRFEREVNKISEWIHKESGRLAREKTFSAKRADMDSSAFLALYYTVYTQAREKKLSREDLLKKLVSYRVTTERANDLKILNQPNETVAAIISDILSIPYMEAEGRIALVREDMTTRFAIPTHAKKEAKKPAKRVLRDNFDFDD